MAPLTTSLIVFYWNQTMYIQLTYQIHLGDSPFFVYLGVNVLASPIMSERSWIHTHEVLSSTHKKKKKLNKRWVLEIQFEMEVTGIVLLSWPTGGKQILYLLFFSLHTIEGGQDWTGNSTRPLHCYQPTPLAWRSHKTHRT